jgi:hypothetical protein
VEGHLDHTTAARISERLHHLGLPARRDLQLTGSCPGGGPDHREQVPERVDGGLYRDRHALIADVGREGYELFGAELERAWNAGRPTPLAAFENMGRAHLAFARNEPAYFSAMFEAGIAPDSEPELAQAADRSCLQPQLASTCPLARK